MGNREGLPVVEILFEHELSAAHTRTNTFKRCSLRTASGMRAARVTVSLRSCKILALKTHCVTICSGHLVPDEVLLSFGPVYSEHCNVA